MVTGERDAAKQHWESLKEQLSAPNLDENTRARLTSQEEESKQSVIEANANVVGASNELQERLNWLQAGIKTDINAGLFQLERETTQRYLKWFAWGILAAISAILLVILISLRNNKLAWVTESASLKRTLGLTAEAGDELACRAVDELAFIQAINEFAKWLLRPAIYLTAITLVTLALCAVGAAFDDNWQVLKNLASEHFWKVASGIFAPTGALIALYAATQGKHLSAIKLVQDVAKHKVVHAVGGERGRRTRGLPRDEGGGGI